MSQERFRQLPSVDQALRDPRLAAMPRGLALRAARAVLTELRRALAEDPELVLPDVMERIIAEAHRQATPRLRGVINATGIVLHTNLGRAPLAPAAQAAIAEVAAGYSNAELDLSSGKRGGRLDGIRGPLQALTGCQDAIVVNNGAAAVVLVLTALAQGREVIVSRGELVEIGGSFRVPDIMAASGARLREVGTTNRTRAADYARAIGPETALLMRVHPSNFKMIGFTERPTTAALAALGPPLVEDLGSGALVPGLGDEPVVGEALRDGAALVCFSGDKLLGGPQAGIIAGQRGLIAACREHPLYRALRVDKLTLAALEATLRLVLAGDLDALPTVRMLRMDPGPAAADLAGRLGELPAPWRLGLESDVGFTGGGALPGEGLPTTVVALRGGDVEALAARLRRGAPPVVARVRRDALVLDPRTILPGEEERLCVALRLALSAEMGQ
ncbi:L-seryl-tRNA(Sec) selenium transferase [Myxococcota bacterium]|nr:L-seryl-tRNA(Sec) selenium transferase [Myxococcota bacterium]